MHFERVIHDAKIPAFEILKKVFRQRAHGQADRIAAVQTHRVMMMVPGLLEFVHQIRAVQFNLTEHAQVREGTERTVHRIETDGPVNFADFLKDGLHRMTAFAFREQLHDVFALGRNAQPLRFQQGQSGLHRIRGRRVFDAGRTRGRGSFIGRFSGGQISNPYSGILLLKNIPIWPGYKKADAGQVRPQSDTKLNGNTGQRAGYCSAQSMCNASPQLCGPTFNTFVSVASALPVRALPPVVDQSEQF